MVREIPKEHLLAKIYYEIGRQNTNFALQHSRKEGDEVVWTKRKTFLDLDPIKDEWFIEHCNHRQILKNEIIFDFDRPISRESAKDDPSLKRLVDRLTAEEWRFCVYHTGSKGIHVHVYWDALILMSKQEREAFRTTLLQHHQWFSGLDLQKAHDSCMIALEHVPHWKTGVKKELLVQSGEEALWT